MKREGYKGPGIGSGLIGALLPLALLAIPVFGGVDMDKYWLPVMIIVFIVLLYGIPALLVLIGNIVYKDKE